MLCVMTECQPSVPSNEFAICSIEPCYKWLARIKKILATNFFARWQDSSHPFLRMSFDLFNWTFLQMARQELIFFGQLISLWQNSSHLFLRMSLRSVCDLLQMARQEFKKCWASNFFAHWQDSSHPKQNMWPLLSFPPTLLTERKYKSRLFLS